VDCARTSPALSMETAVSSFSEFFIVLRLLFNSASPVASRAAGTRCLRWAHRLRSCMAHSDHPALNVQNCSMRSPPGSAGPPCSLILDSRSLLLVPCSLLLVPCNYTEPCESANPVSPA